MPCYDQAAVRHCAVRQCSSQEDATGSCSCKCYSDSGCASYPVQRRRRRNRFTCYRSQTLPMPPQLPLLLLLLVAVGISMLPLIACNEHKAEAEVITHVTTSKTPIDSDSPANNTITAKSTHDEDNEIFTVVDDDIVKEVKTSPDFVSSKFEYPETSLTESLEETIRNSVKNQIEIEHNIGSSTGQLLKDISEAEVRQKLTEEILSIEYPQKAAKGVGALKGAGVEELGGANYTELQSPDTQGAAVLEFSALKVDTQAQKLDGSPGADENTDAVIGTHAQSSEAEVGSQRGARNLESAISSGANLLSSVDDAENLGFQSIEEEKSEEQVAAASSSSTSSMSSSSSSSSSSESSDSKSTKETGNDDLVVAPNVEMENSENSIDNSDVLKIEDNIGAESNVPSNLPAFVEPPQWVASITAESVDTLSIVFNENLTATEPTAQLEDDQLESLIHLEETINESHVTETTITPDIDKTVHVVIKKQGVDLNEDIIDTAPQAVLETFAGTTTVLPVVDEASTVAIVSDEVEKVAHSNMATIHGYTNSAQQTEDETTPQPQLQTEYSVAETTRNEIVDEQPEAQLEQKEHVTTTEKEFDEQTIFQYEDTSEGPVEMQPDEQPVNQQTEVPSDPQNDVNNTADAVVDEATIESTSDTTTQKEFETYEDDGDDYSNPDIAPAVMGGADVTASTKGSRSINTQTHQSVEDSAAATLFESFPPHVAGQTFNDNLAAESAGGMGKVLPARSISEASYLSRTSVIIVVCSGMALLFLVVSIAFFVVSFQRQHGTLDIEMQEQRCGKDSLDEDDDADTCTKLLEIELPQSTVTIATAEETDECL